MEPEGQPFAVQTEFGVVSCLFFNPCGSKAGGRSCVDCTRNTYSVTKVRDFYEDIMKRREEILGSITDALGKLTDEQIKNGNTLLISIDIKRVKFVDVGVMDNLQEAGNQIQAAVESLNRAGVLVADVAHAEVR
jgi:hypothetical protein